MTRPRGGPLVAGLVFFGVIIFLYALIGASNDNNWIGEQVVCYDLPAKIVGEVVYDEGDYIVIKGRAEVFVGYTGGTERYEECEGCSPGVQRVIIDGAKEEWRYESDIEVPRKKHECKRQDGLGKYKDSVRDYRMYMGE